MNTMIEKLAEMLVVPVVVLDDEKDAEMLADALVKGGLPCAEVTFRTAKDTAPQEGRKPDQEEKEYILNTNTMKFHVPGCSSAAEMGPENKKEFKGTREELLEQGYSPCGRCKP